MTTGGSVKRACDDEDEGGGGCGGGAPRSPTGGRKALGVPEMVEKERTLSARRRKDAGPLGEESLLFRR